MLFTLFLVITTTITGVDAKKNRLHLCSRFLTYCWYNSFYTVMRTMKLFRRLLFRFVKLEFDAVDKRLIGGFYDVVRNSYGPPSAFLIA